MSDLEQTIFDQVCQLLWDFSDRSTLSFLEQKQLKGQLEAASAEYVGALLAFLSQEKTAPARQQQLLKNCFAKVRSMTSEQLRGFVAQSGSTDVETRVLTSLATLLLEVSKVVIGGHTSAPNPGRRLEKAVANSKALLIPTNPPEMDSAKSAASAPAESLSFDISSFTEESAPAEEVSFTALYPREIGIEAWNPLLVYAHLTSAIESIRKDSERFKDQITAPKEVTVAATTPLVRGTELTIVPQCEGIMFNPQRITLAWLEDFHRADFRFRADKSLADDAARGRIDIYVGPLIVGSLKLSMLVGATSPASTEPQEEQASLYKQDDIFISYSHKDTDVVLGFKKAYEAIGQNILIDIDELRSGQDWNAELLKMIERAEIFQLYWSENSSQSKYCRQEWEYALKLDKGPGFIRPCYWKMPMPNPPVELGHLHFEFVQL